VTVVELSVLGEHPQKRSRVVDPKAAAMMGRQ
jgi:hypothetical protein